MSAEAQLFEAVAGLDAWSGGGKDAFVDDERASQVIHRALPESNSVSAEITRSMI